MTRRALAAWSVLAALVSACAGASVGSASPSAGPSATPVHWSYEGESGPDRWGDLSADYATCRTGAAQSPIDVADAAPDDLANISFDYRPAPLEIANNGHTVQVTYPAGSGIALDGTTYQLLQFHFHAPSEHTVDGTQAEAELHLVHRDADGALAVVGVLLEEGADNPAFAPVFGNLPTEAGPATTVPDAEVDAGALLPGTQTTYRYPGSLTTPPCTEGVSWLLMREPVEVSAEQLATLSGVIEGNNRPVQPVNDREVVEDTTP